MLEILKSIMVQSFYYLHKAIITMQPIFAVIYTGIIWLLFPLQGIKTVGILLMLMMSLDFATKAYALKKTGKSIASKRFWDGSLPKVVSFGITFMIAGISIHLDTFLSPIGKLFAIWAYGAMFFREIKSIDENLMEAGNFEFHNLMSGIFEGTRDKLKGLFGIEVSFIGDSKKNQAKKKKKQK